tara:strand:+ start:286 stop:435 length:150 start_codon:yes stop_codon:yes gene_type:complete
MNKDLVRLIGIQVLIIGIVLSIFEFLIENSEVVIGIGIITLIVSIFLKK